MSEVVKVASQGGSYDVHVGAGLLARCGGITRDILGARRGILVTDENVASLYADGVVASLREAGADIEAVVIPPGERSKSWELAGALAEHFAVLGIGRDGMVVALGGGVVGDLSGFVAAVYLRGIPIVQVPTTLLAQVDSSIGGKTGVDLEAGKNLAGAFWPPAAVIADTACLATLSATEWASGMAEVAKSAFLDGEESVAGLERDARALAARDAGAVERAVLMAARLKARVVSGDERESGARECLNYGHTLGHAIEHVAGYGSVAHGIAVGEGIRFAASVADRLGEAGTGWSDRQAALLDSLGVASTPGESDVPALARVMYADKKVRDGRVRMVLTQGPGLWSVRAMEREELVSALDAWASGPGGVVEGEAPRT